MKWEGTVSAPKHCSDTMYGCRPCFMKIIAFLKQLNREFCDYGFAFTCTVLFDR